MNPDAKRGFICWRSCSVEFPGHATPVDAAIVAAAAGTVALSPPANVRTREPQEGGDNADSQGIRNGNGGCRCWSGGRATRLGTRYREAARDLHRQEAREGHRLARASEQPRGRQRRQGDALRAAGGGGGG